MPNLWPFASVIIALLVWDALRKWLSRDDLVRQVDSLRERQFGHGKLIADQSRRIEELKSSISDLERIAHGTRDKLAAENAAKMNRPAVAPAKWPGFDRVRRE